MTRTFAVKFAIALCLSVLCAPFASAQATINSFQFAGVGTNTTLAATIAAAGNGGTVIVPPGYHETIMSAVVITQQNLTIKCEHGSSFTLGASIPAPNFPVTYQGMITVDQGASLTMDGCDLISTNSVNTGGIVGSLLSTNSGTLGVTLTNNTFENCYYYCAYLIDLPSGFIHGNTFTRSRSDAISLTGDATNVIILRYDFRILRWHDPTLHVERRERRSSGSVAGWSGAQIYNVGSPTVPVGPFVQWQHRFPNSTDYGTTRYVGGFYLNNGGTCVNATLQGSDNPSPCNYAIIRYSTVAADPAYMCVIGNATGQQAVSTGVAPTANAVLMSVSLDDSDKPQPVPSPDPPAFWAPPPRPQPPIIPWSLPTALWIGTSPNPHPP